MMASDTSDEMKLFRLSIRGMLFFGVPNQGMESEHLRAIVRGKPNEDLINILGKDSQVLRRLHKDFREALPFQDCEVYSFYETRMSLVRTEVCLVTILCFRGTYTYEASRKTENLSLETKRLSSSLKRQPRTAAGSEKQRVATPSRSTSHTMISSDSISRTQI
jgi:hypothetical protein